jgi:NAD(P)H-flavin reductase
MPEVVCSIAEIRIEGRTTCAFVPLSGVENYTPGQYALAISPGSGEILPSVLFPLDWNENGLLLPLPEAVHWTAGTELKFHAPLGNGFNLPVSARRIALVDFQGSGGRLLPLLGSLPKMEASIAMLRAKADLDLPEEVEMLPLDSLADISAWADFIALDLDLSLTAEVRSRYLFKENDIRQSVIQVLVNLPMVCGANAECGLCAVRTRRGWKLGCKDGPVFDWRELED